MHHLNIDEQLIKQRTDASCYCRPSYSRIQRYRSALHRHALMQIAHINTKAKLNTRATEKMNIQGYLNKKEIIKIYLSREIIIFSYI